MSPVAPELDPAPMQITNLNHAFEALRLLREADAEECRLMAELDALYEAAMAPVCAAAEKRLKLHQQIRPALEAFAQRFLEEAGAEAIVTAAGTLSFHERREVVEITDEAAAVAWASVHCREAIEVRAFVAVERLPAAIDLPSNAFHVTPARRMFSIDVSGGENGNGPL